MNQIIMHVDMDAFYASVEVRDNPTLRGKALIIGSLPTERGVVATCSYETRKFGVHSGIQTTAMRIFFLSFKNLRLFLLKHTGNALRLSN